MYNVSCDFRDGIAFVTVTGEFVFEEFAEGWRKVIANPSFRRGMPIIIDCDRVTRRSSGLDDARRTVKFVFDTVGPEIGPWPLVWVASEPGFDTYIKLLEMLIKEFGELEGLPNLSAVPAHFRTMEEAQNWVRKFMRSPPSRNT